MTALDGPISDQALDRLRASAAMALAIPQLAVQIRADGTTCLEVRRTPRPGASHRVLPPCAFHRAVAHAVRMRRAGERLAMRDVPAGCEPAIDWGVVDDARILPGGVVRIVDGDTWRLIAPVLAGQRLVAGGLVDAPGLAPSWDEALDVTLVHGATSCGDKPGSRALADAIVDLIARVGVADLEHRLSGRRHAGPEARMWR